MPQNPNWYVAAKQYPAVTGLIVLSAIGGMLVTLSYPTAVRYFSFGGFSGEDSGVSLHLFFFILA